MVDGGALVGGEDEVYLPPPSQVVKRNLREVDISLSRRILGGGSNTSVNRLQSSVT